jgi:hypothetical protein
LNSAEFVEINTGNRINQNDILSTRSIVINNQIEVVDEIVEQALVENLLEGNLYSTNNIDLIQSNQMNQLINNNSVSTNEITNLQSVSSESNNLVNVSAINTE